MKLLLLALSLATPAFACLCIDQPRQRAFEHATAVFTGKILATSAGRSGSAEVEVIGVHKGALAAKSRIRVATGGPGTACGYTFEKGHAYVIWAHGTANELRTNLCTRTRPLASAQDDLAWLMARAAAR